MMPYEDALAAVLACAAPGPEESVPLECALGRVLAQDVFMDLDVPPFDKSAVDGFACRRADLPGLLAPVGEVAAGSPARRGVGPGECMAIMTGAPMPEGADCVVMQEQSEVAPDGRVRMAAAPESNNYCPAGEDLRAGGLVLARGARLGPQHLAALATAGCAHPRVHGVPRVGVIATGSELVPPDQTPAFGQIRDSNSAQIAALLRQTGCEPALVGRAEDTPDALLAAFGRAFESCDVLLSTGGVSVGAYDLVPGIAEELGMAVHVRKVGIQPGKPVLFATGDGRALFGLSGNPVSSFVQFLLFARPYLLRRMGAAHTPRPVRVPLAHAVARKNAARMLWLPVRLTPEGAAERVPYHGSAHLFALLGADGLIALQPGEVGREAGAHADVWLI